MDPYLVQMRADQGLPPEVVDPVTVRQLAALLRPVLEHREVAA